MDFFDDEESPEDYVAGLSSIERLEALQTLLIDRARGGEPDPGIYKALRAALQSEPWWSALPGFVRSCRTPREFWSFIKPRFSTYAERTDLIQDELRPVFDRLEGRPAPTTSVVGNTLTTLDAHEAHIVWEKALARVEDDPDGAITSACSLLETACKLILDDRDDPEFSYKNSDNLKKLVNTTTSAIGLSPDDHTEKVFKQTLSGVRAVVDGIGNVRNHLGDAHGKGRSPVRATPRHATFVVNLAGATAQFLIETAAARAEAGMKGG